MNPGIPHLVAHTCDACKRTFQLAEHGPSVVVSGYLLLRVCPDCTSGYSARYGTRCVNCDGWIEPHCQVGVYKLADQAVAISHATVACNPAGNTFYGYWGKGELSSRFGQIEMC